MIINFLKKLLSILVFSLLFGGSAFAETLEFKDCWVTNSKSLNHNYEKTELSYENIDDYNKIKQIEFQKFSINATTNSLVRTIKYSEDNRLFPDELSQTSVSIESWDSEYLKASGTDIGRTGTANKRTFIINMVSGEIQYTQRIFESSNTVFYMKNDYKIICNNISSDIAGEVGGSSGTAFFINNKGYLLTNNHVVEGCSLSKITYKNKDYETKLIATDQTLDLALLKTEIKPKSYFAFAKDEAKKLNKVYVAGYPLGNGLSDDLKISSGIVSSLKGFEDNSNEIQIDAPINPGNSGGPIINENANLVAIAVSGLAKDQTEGINFGIKSSAAETFLKANNINPKKSMYSGIKENDKLLEILEEGTVYTYCN